MSQPTQGAAIVDLLGRSRTYGEPLAHTLLPRSVRVTFTPDGDGWELALADGRRMESHQVLRDNGQVVAHRRTDLRGEHPDTEDVARYTYLPGGVLNTIGVRAGREWLEATVVVQADGRIAELDWRAEGGALVLVDRLVYDEVGRLVRHERDGESSAEAAPPDGVPDVTTRWVYDGVNLVSASVSGTIDDVTSPGSSPGDPLWVDVFSPGCASFVRSAPELFDVPALGLTPSQQVAQQFLSSQRP